MHWCISASGCNSGIRDKHREIIGFALARTLPQIDSAIWDLGKCSCGWHFASPPVSATVGFRWSAELNTGQNSRGVWEGTDSSGFQIKAPYPLRADQCGCQHVPLYLMHPHCCWQWKAGTVEQQRRWQKCRVSTGTLISNAHQHTLTVTAAVCCWAGATLQRKQWQPWWQRQPPQNCCQQARKHRWGQIHHSNSRN